ncbi:MAG: hypothetical protein HFG73_11440 [Hungatella sp.]|nr:hypothetical protein [Hungatella sp.]
MTQVERMIFDEALDKAWGQAMKEGKKAEEEEGRKEGRKEGKREGEKLGAAKAELLSIKNLMSTMKLTPEQAMNALKIPAANRQKYLAKLAKNNHIH